ncbi:MAG: metabolite traffic protein EboE [Nitrospirae bacterium]|nr:metabolite traffic protein EboE [Nitrospirota bacterium]
MLAYCTNIHPGESWPETRANIENYTLRVKESISPNRLFPIGLRLSARAASEISGDEAARFAGWLGEHGCFVPTINGFPYGQFHGSAVKENVYLPDWRSPERVTYTKRLADILAAWLPASAVGSISTVPVGFRSAISGDDMPLVQRNIIETLNYLADVRERSGCEIVLSLEPEPACVLETTAELAQFIDSLALSPAQSRFVGICLDCCHQAVEFENPTDCLRLLADAGVRIGKVQVSSGLVIDDIEKIRKSDMKRFIDPVYLHQVAARRPGGAIDRFNDLPDALKAWKCGEGQRRSLGQWRIHYHVPVFAERFGPFGTTRFFLEEVIPMLDPSVLLEVETYTWDVLPPELRLPGVTDSIIREMRWVEGIVGSVASG